MTRTLYVIAYDIVNNSRRAKVHKTLSGVGMWTQYSLFECFLDEKELITLQAKLNKLINPEQDSLRFYPLCGHCVDKVQTVGSSKPRESILFVV